MEDELLVLLLRSLYSHVNSNVTKHTLIAKQCQATTVILYQFKPSNSTSRLSLLTSLLRSFTNNEAGLSLNYEKNLQSRELKQMLVAHETLIGEASSYFLVINSCSSYTPGTIIYLIPNLILLSFLIILIYFFL